MQRTAVHILLIKQIEKCHVKFPIFFIVDKYQYQDRKVNSNCININARRIYQYIHLYVHPGLKQ